MEQGDARSGLYTGSACGPPRDRDWGFVLHSHAPESGAPDHASLEPQAGDRTDGVSAYERQHQYDERNIRRPKNYHEGHLLHRAPNDMCQTYDRWTNVLVRSCWSFPYRWPNLGLLPFRIRRRVSTALPTALRS